jgi:hypothetical protein
MLSYKEYKQLNESLYGAINLGIKNPSSVSGPIGALGATEVMETETEENEELSLEEAKKMKCKCGKMMKKGMDCGCDSDKHEDEDSEKEEKEDSEDEDEDSEDEDSEEDSEEKMMMKKKMKMKMKMKKKSKKEWNEILADFDSLLEGKDTKVVSQVRSNLENIKNLLEEKEMTEDEKAWWASVSDQLGSIPGDLGFAPVGKITQGIR